MDTLLAVQVRRLLLHWLVRTTAGVQDYCADRLRGIVGSVHPATKRHLNKETWKLAVAILCLEISWHHKAKQSTIRTDNLRYRKIVTKE